VKKIIAIAVAVLFLSACDNAESGYVESKQHHPEYTTYDMQCMSYNKNGFCTVNIPIPRIVPECWELNYYNKEDDEYGHACVDRRSFETFTLGMHYPDPK
jgi:hypothetical protein